MIKRGLLLGAMVYMLFIGGLAFLDGRIVALAAPLLVYLAMAVLYGPATLRLNAVRELEGERVSAGVPVDVRVTVTNKGPAIEEAVVQDLLAEQQTVREGASSVLTRLPAGASVTLHYTLEGARGLHQAEGVRVTAADALGVFPQETTVPTPASLNVLPQVPKLRGIPIRPRRTLAYSGLIPARRGGPGVEFFGLREYQLGDPLRWAHWKAAARHPERFFTKEFEQECITEVGIILDVRRRAYESADEEHLFERAIQATAALAEALLNEGNQVGLLLFGSALNWTVPGYGRVQRERILRALAAAAPGGFLDRLEFLPTRLFPARSQIVLVSPLLKADLRMLTLLRAHGYHLLVVSPSPLPQLEDCAGRAERAAVRVARLERTLLLRNLREAGIRLLDWRVDQPLENAVHTRLGRRAQVLTGLQGV